MQALVVLKSGPVVRQMTELEFSRASYRDDSGVGPSVRRLSVKAQRSMERRAIAAAAWKTNLASVDATTARMRR